MKFNNIIICFVISLFLVNFVVATTVYDYYMGVNESELFKYYPQNLTLNYNLLINGSTYNLTGVSDYFYTYVTCSEDEDLAFQVLESNLSLINGTFRCRTPFYLNVYLKKENETITTLLNKDSYCDDFSYVMLKPYTDKISVRTIDSINSMFKWIPGYSTLPKIKTQYSDVVFWNNYNSCYAKIKMYELGNYSIIVGSTKIKPTFIEFIDPRNQDESYFSDITNYNPYEVTNKTDTDVLIYASLWELSNERYLSNYLNIGLIIGLIILIPIIIIFGIKRLFR